MELLFTRDFAPLWALLLALALFLPVRKLIFVLYVRRASRAGAMPKQAELNRLRRRAGVTAGLLCFVFSILYTYSLFRGPA